MTANRDEVGRVIRRMQARTAELRSAGRSEPERRAAERDLERLRWRLADLARRSAADAAL